MDNMLKSIMKNKHIDKLPSILMTAAECAPFAKTGGLADVVGTLSRKLKDFGFDIRLALPFHRVIKDQLRDKVTHIASFSVDLGWRTQYVGLELYDWDGVPIYFIDNEYYFGHMIYRGGTFEGEQYAYFCRAILESLPFADFTPDIVHVNDWHTAMIPMLIKTQYRSRAIRDCKTVLSMHSLGYQGRFDFGFASELLAIDSRYNTPDYIEYYGGVNFMKAGIVFADKLVTVSPSYAEEIKTPYYGEGLDGILNTRAADLVGILNGIDTDAFNPATDTLIEKAYDENTLENKLENKKALIGQLGLKIDIEKPLIGMVTRLTKQKGLDLLMRVMNEIIDEGAGLTLLGTGDAEYENFFRDAWHAFGGRVNGMIMFDEALAHKIYAGCDFFLMPSRFEPCGLSQIISLRYGTLPIVRETGGLKDTVKPYNQHTGEGDGFSFMNYNAHEMLDCIRYALSVYKDKEAFRALQKHAMSKDLSFDKSALAYSALYLVSLDMKDTQD